jgi:glycerol-3-phosphate dehydrogenase
VSQAFGIAAARAETLLERYGTHAERHLEAHAGGPDISLQSLPGYTVSEIRSVVRNEKVVDLADLVFRRTSIAFSGQLSASVIGELSQIAAETLGWDEAERNRQIAQTCMIARRRHGIDLSMKETI